MQNSPPKQGFCGISPQVWLLYKVSLKNLNKFWQNHPFFPEKQNFRPLNTFPTLCSSAKKSYFTTFYSCMCTPVNLSAPRGCCNWYLISKQKFPWVDTVPWLELNKCTFTFVSEMRQIQCTGTEFWCVQCPRPAGPDALDKHQIQGKCFDLSHFLSKSKYKFINLIHTWQKKTKCFAWVYEKL